MIQILVTENSSDCISDFNVFSLSAVRALGLPPFLPLLWAASKPALTRSFISVKKRAIMTQ